MYTIPPFCAEWRHFIGLPDTEQEAYVARELERIDAEGHPILTTILQSSHDGVKHHALRILAKGGRSADGRRVVSSRLWTLRLVEGAQPPPLDPGGVPLPQEKRGKVLVAKTGNLGGDVPLRGGSPDREWMARERLKRAQSRQPLYRTVELTREPMGLELDEAVAVLRQWGYGVRSQQYRSHATGDPDKHGQDQWLVEEVPPERRAPAPPAEKRAAATAR